MLDIFEKIHELPRIPKVVQELIESFENEEARIEEIAHKIALDQVITAKVLRLANSARFGGTRNIASVDDAIIRLGFNALRTLVVASGVTTAFNEVSGVDKQAFWTKSFTVALLAKEIARMSKIDPEAAFTCGMLHNIGHMLIRLGEPKQAEKIAGQIASGAKEEDAENEALGYGGAQVGAELAKQWHFPSLIHEAIAHQHQPENADEAYRKHVLTLTIAVRIFEEETIRPEDFPAHWIEQLNLDLEQIADAFPELREAGKEFFELIGS